MRFGIVERNADVDFAEVRSAEEAKERLLQVIDRVAASFSIVNNARDVFDVAVDKINALALDGKPGAAVYPWTPTVEIGYDGRGRVVYGFGELTKGVDGEWGGLGIEQAEVDVGIGLGAATRVGAAEDDSFEAGDFGKARGESGNKLTLIW